MNRTLAVDVDYSSWPTGGAPPFFPPSFHVGTAGYALNIPSMLLMIGYLTTPTSSTGVSLSEFWAWVRYLAAVTNDVDMRLTSSFADLDAHQKTILSDDFGMGVPMVWLTERLAFDRICDGRYFLERIAATIGATARRTAKRGPNKAPDFVARDTSGVWHVIECKGTQSGLDYSLRQLGSPAPPSGGVAQKRSIIFPPAYTGQRLVTGLSIAVEGGVEDSRLTIIDPEPEEEPFEIASDQISYAEDAATRSVVAKTLRLSGFEIVAEATASPLGQRPGTTRSTFRRTEEARRSFVDERDVRARDELDKMSRRRSLFDKGTPFRGRELTFDLPRSILVKDRPVLRAIVRQGVNENLLVELRERPTIENSLTDDARLFWKEAVGSTRVEGDELSASMQIGDVFRSEIYLD